MVTFIMDWVFWGLAIFVLLNGIDMVLTNSVIQHGGKEFNPVIKWIYSKFGLCGMGILKGLILTIFSIQYSAGVLDLWTIWYFSFSYFVILTMMYIDIKKSGAKIIGVGIK